MNYSFKAFFQNLYREQGQQFAFKAQNKEEFYIWREAFRSALEEQLGLNRLKVIGKAAANRQARLLYESQKDGYLCRKYVLETLPHVFMPFYMLIPDAVLKGKRACAMITVPAHGADKNTVCGIAETKEEAKKIETAADECYGQIFAQRGYVVLCPDPPGYGERVEPLPAEDRFFLPGRERTALESSCKDLAQTAEAFSLSLTALEIWELQRLLDFACSCPEIAADRKGPLVGCAGFSGGGQYSMWLAAIDERIRLAVISGYVHGYLDSLLDCHLCPCNYAPGLWLLGDISDICSLIAPRPLFVENGRNDIENGPDGITGPEKQVAKIRKAYQLLHREEQLVHYTPEGPHRWFGGCYPFVDRYMPVT